MAALSCSVSFLEQDVLHICTSLKMVLLLACFVWLKNGVKTLHFRDDNIPVGNVRVGNVRVGNVWCDVQNRTGGYVSVIT